jgi:hypothetical protein
MTLFAWRVTLAPLLAACALMPSLASANTVGGAPLIPEPMVFDMIRPLAAPRGKLEVNTLALFPLRAKDEDVDWAPEIDAFSGGAAGFGVQKPAERAVHPTPAITLIKEF